MPLPPRFPPLAGPSSCALRSTDFCVDVWPTAHTQLFCQPPCRLLSDPGTQCERAPLIRQTQALPGASPRAPGRQRPSREHLAECSACGRQKLEGSFGGG